MRAAAGQLLIVGFNGTSLSPKLGSLLKEIQPAGVILFARNILNGQQTCQLLKQCQGQVREPLFTCIDLEGGRVDRLRNLTGPAPSAADVFRTSDHSLYRRHGAIIGKICSALGFNVDFAPVLDLALEASRKVMNSRSVSASPEEVIAFAREFLAGLRSAKVIGAGKHFPGLGEGRLDSHRDLPVIRKPFEKLWAEDLVPYRRMRRELRMVLVAHANYPEVTRDRQPASLSKRWITDILRRKIGCRGLVVSDDLEMGGVLRAAPIAQAAVEFIEAGGDLALVCREPQNVEAAFEAIVKTAERKAGFRRRVAESARRIAAFKQASPELKRRLPSPPPEKISRLSTELWEFSERVRLSSLASAAQAEASS
jgi:beta-N-acetylhexosaminidase